MLKSINGTPEIDKCIKKVFAPVNFVGRFSLLDTLILEFNQFLAFDGWQVVRQGKEINFSKAGEINFADSEPKSETNESDFLNHEFKDFNIDSIGLDAAITGVLTLRFEEIKTCLSSGVSLSVIFMCGSTLEGILLGIALKKPQEFNKANSSPKDKEGKVINHIKNGL